jgi:hypothetical protein
MSAGATIIAPIAGSIDGGSVSPHGVEMKATLKAYWRRYRLPGESLRRFARRQGRAAIMGAPTTSIEGQAARWVANKGMRP